MEITKEFTISKQEGYGLYKITADLFLNPNQYQGKNNTIYMHMVRL